MPLFQNREQIWAANMACGGDDAQSSPPRISLMSKHFPMESCQLDCIGKCSSSSPSPSGTNMDQRGPAEHIWCSFYAVTTRFRSHPSRRPRLIPIRLEVALNAHNSCAATPLIKYPTSSPDVSLYNLPPVPSEIHLRKWVEPVLPSVPKRKRNAQCSLPFVDVFCSIFYAISFPPLLASVRDAQMYQDPSFVLWQHFMATLTNSFAEFIGCRRRYFNLAKRLSTKNCARGRFSSPILRLSLTQRWLAGGSYLDLSIYHHLSELSFFFLLNRTVR